MSGPTPTSPPRSRAWPTAPSTIAANPAARSSASTSTRRCGSPSSTAWSRRRRAIGWATRSTRRRASGRWRAPPGREGPLAGRRRSRPAPWRMSSRSCSAPTPATSAYLMPQVLTGVDHDMRVMREETFGPVIGLIKVRDDEEAIALMNDSDLGLHRLGVDARPRSGRAAGAADRGGHPVRQSLRLSRSGPGLDRLQAERARRSLGRWGFESVTRPRSFHLRPA